MPYANQLIKKWNDHVRNRDAKLIRELTKKDELVRKNTLKAMYDEACAMYDSFIDQYYKYKTLSYYRHDVGVGTGTGLNLYLGQNITLSEHDVNIQFLATDMQPYITKKKERVSRKDVLDIVMAGYRGVPGKWIRTWSGSYDGKYFSISDTNPQHAFEVFEDHWDMITYSIAKEQNELIKASGQFKYFR